MLTGSSDWLAMPSQVKAVDDSERNSPQPELPASFRRPHRLEEDSIDKRDQSDIGEADLGNQLLRHGELSSFHSASSSRPSRDAPRPHESRLLSVRKKRLETPASSSELLTALTALLSPKLVDQQDVNHVEEVSPGVLAGLGISAPALQSKPPSRVGFESEATSKNGVNVVSLSSDQDDLRDYTYSSPSIPNYRRYAPVKRSIQQIRRSGSRRQSLLASPSNGDGDFSSSTTIRSESTLSSFVSSPLSKAWSSPESSTSPQAHASPFVFHEALASLPSSTPSTPTPYTTTATLSHLSDASHIETLALASPHLDGTPRTTQTPFFSPILEFSDVFGPPTASEHAQEYAGTHETSSTARAGPATGFYNAVIATSVIGAAMCMGAFGILTWLLLRKRTSDFQRPVISQPMLKYAPHDAEDPNGHLESGGMARADPRKSEAPSIPESILPSTGRWRYTVYYPSPTPSSWNLYETSVAHSTIHRNASSEESTKEVVNEQTPCSDGAAGSNPGSTGSEQATAVEGKQAGVPPICKSQIVDSDVSRHGGRAALPGTVEGGSTHLPDTPITAAVDEPRKGKVSTFSTQDHRMRLDNTGDRPASAEEPFVNSGGTRGASVGGIGEITLPSTISAPSDLGSAQREFASQTTSSTLAALSDSISTVLLNQQGGNKKHLKSRPMSQDGAIIRNKLKKSAPHNKGLKGRPLTIGGLPPSILVTSHPQLLIPPSQPAQVRTRDSLYSLSDTLPYLASARESLASFDIIPRVPDCRNNDTYPALPPRARQSSQISSWTRDTEDCHQRHSLAESCRSEALSDYDNDEARRRRSQRRMTLLDNVSQQTSDQAKSSQLEGAVDSLNFRQQADSTDYTPSTRASRDLIQGPVSPATPLYTPKTSSHNLQHRLPAETPTKRSRSVSAQESGHVLVLDPSLTRFSRIDLASELASGKFGSNGSLKSAASRVAGDASVTRKPSLKTQSTSTSSVKEQSGLGTQRNLEDTPYLPQRETAQPAPDRPLEPFGRARASTISCDQLRSHAAGDGVLTAARVPIPSRGKAMRVSFVGAQPEDHGTRPVRTFAQDLRASVSSPSVYLPAQQDHRSRESLASSYRLPSEYDFDRMLARLERRQRSSTGLPSRNAASKKAGTQSGANRTSSGSLTVPGTDDQDEDDQSIYSRDSGSHESAWEIAKARVRARASLALPSTFNESNLVA